VKAAVFQQGILLFASSDAYSVYVGSIKIFEEFFTIVALSFFHCSDRAVSSARLLPHILRVVMLFEMRLL
jgi:hypothetical protein